MRCILKAKVKWKKYKALDFSVQKQLGNSYFQTYSKMLYLLALLALMPSAMAGPGKISSLHLYIRKFRQIPNWLINLFKILFHNHYNSHSIKLI